MNIPESLHRGNVHSAVLNMIDKQNNTRVENFSLGGKEHKVRDTKIVSFGGKLPYYLELQTGKIIDVL